MKKVKSLILCALLVASFILSAMPVALATETDPHAHTGFTEKLSKFDFQDLDAGTKIYKAADSDYDETGTFFINVEEGIEIVTDDTEHGNVAKFTGVTQQSTNGIGISKKYTQTADGNNPEIVKLELELKRETNAATYLYVGKTSSGNDGRLMLWSGSDNSIGFYNEDANKSSVGTGNAAEWKKFTLYFDFGSSRNYCAYIDDVFAGTFTIPTSITNLETFYITTQTTVSVDNISVYTLPEPLEITSITPADASKGVDLKPEISAKFNHVLNDVDDSMVTVTGGTATPEYNVSSSGDTLKVFFTESLELKTEYTVTFNANISSTNGLNLGAAVTKTFTTTDSDMNAGYTSVIADFDFDDLTVDTVITREGSNAHDVTKTYYVQTDGTVTVKKFNDEYKNVLLLEKGTSLAVAGVARVHSQKYPSYVQTKKYPSLIKTEVEIYKNDTAAAYIYVGNTNDVNQLMLWSSSAGFKFRYQDGDSTAQDTTNIFEETKEWHKVTFYIDFNNGEYAVYLDGTYVKTYDLPTAVTNAELFYVRTNGSAYVDNMSVTTIPAYEAPVISEYTNSVGENKLAFVGTNTGDTAKAYKIICAKFNSDDTLDNVTITDGEIAASAKLSLEELAYPTKGTDGSYYRYFVWDSMTTLVPLVESIKLD